MGTKVQCKSYLPGYNLVRGRDDDRNSSWSMFCDGKTLNGYLYNDFVMKPMNGYLEYDKEMLKRTMLEHEAVFRKQVYELHRLYRIQKNLMDEVKRKELYKYPAHMSTSQTLQAISFSSQILLEETKTMLHTTHLPVEDTCYSRGSAAGLDNMKCPLNFLKDNQSSVQSGQSSVENGGSVRDDELLESRCNNSFPRRVLDLHLPADAYIDHDDKERSEKEHVVESSFREGDFLKISHCTQPENNVVLTLGTGRYSAPREHNESSHSRTKNGISVHNLTDLSDPMKGSFSVAKAGSTATYAFGPRTHDADIQESKLLLNAHTSSLNLKKDLLGGNRWDKGASSKYVYSEMELMRHESSMFRNNSGQSSGNVSFSPCLYDGKPKMSSKEMELKPYGMHGVVISDKAKIQSWFNTRPPDDVEDYGRNSRLAGSNRSVMAGALTTEACCIVPTDHFITASSLDSSWRKPTNRVSHIPIAVQALPCFNTAATLNLQHSGSNTQHEDQRSYLKAKSDPFAYPNGIHHSSLMDPNPASHSSYSSIFSGKTNQHIGSDSSGFRTLEGHITEKLGLYCMDVKSAKDLNLNQAFSSGIQDSHTSDRDSLILGMERKDEGLSGADSWFGHKSSVEKTVERNTAKMELGSTRSYSQLLPSFSAVASGYDRKREKDGALFISSLQEFPSTSEVKESRMQRNEASDGMSNRRILEFPILENVHQNGICSPSVTRESQSLNNDTKCNKRETPHYTDNKMPTMENQLDCGSANGSGSCSFNFRNQINLNCSLTCVENPESTAIWSSAKVALEIDLEAPVICQGNDDINLLPQSLAAKHQLTPEQSVSSKVDCSSDTENLHEKCMREAAECIIALSMETSGNSEALSRHKMPPTGCDILHWFVEVVSSNAEEESKRGHRVSESLDGDSLDLFEIMALQLEETKMDECWCQPQEPAHRNNEGKNAASLLLTRRRRGRARKRKQRRDFQKDILPGLASLARHEVREDLQAIGGLMKASGGSSQTSLSRRNTSRNGTQGQARRVRRPRGEPVSPEIHVSTLPLKPVTTDIEDGGAIVGWGRTTRRCRRPRCPPGNVNAPLV